MKSCKRDWAKPGVLRRNNDQQNRFREVLGSAKMTDLYREAETRAQQEHDAYLTWAEEALIADCGCCKR